VQRGERFRFVFIVGVIVALISAGIGLAGDAIDEPDETPTCEPTDVVDEGDTDVDTEDAIEGEEGEESEEGEEAEEGEESEEGEEGEEGEESEEGEECEEPAGDETESDLEGDEVAEEAYAVAEPSKEHVQACVDAASETDVEFELDPEQAPVPGELQGLENAIAHVFWNCVHHENLGLVNALDHLTDNFNAKLEREELKAERKAEREAAKAEREAAKAEREAAKAEREAEREARKAAREAARAA
jgi:hypothetical protein